MSTTTDPRTVGTGRVAISATSQVKREALLGRVTEVQLCSGTFVGVIEAVGGTRAVVRFADGRWAWTGSTVRLLAVEDLAADVRLDVRGANRQRGRHSLPAEATTR